MNFLSIQRAALDTGYRKNILPNLATFVHPSKALQTKALQKLWRKFPVGAIDTRIKYDIFDRAEYAYGVYHAARLARGTGLTRLSVIEFGVAGGAGLLALERIAEEIGRFFQIDIDVLGFDSGVRLPRPPDDYRDHPYLWEEGYFRMDEELLMSKLRSAKLILGDVAETVPQFMTGSHVAPIGFVSFDLDYYSSTRDAFKLFDYSSPTRLPRVYCYFDDVCSPDWAAYNPFCGELLAIEEFNCTNQRKKIAKLPHLHLQRVFPDLWNEQMYVLHDFDHAEYGRNILPAELSQLRV